MIELRCYRCPDQRWHIAAEQLAALGRKPPCPGCKQSDEVYTLDVPQVPAKSAPPAVRGDLLGPEPPLCEACVLGLPHEHPARPGEDLAL